MTRRYLKAVILAAAILAWGGAHAAPLLLAADESAEEPTVAEDTLLMFVGEDLDVLTIASRREDSAWKAPAVADVLTREELRERGVTTLSRALSMVPGFYMAQREWGYQPYLRGVPNSALFLYDAVPMGSDTSKALNPIDHQLSLESVKRVEIVRGPGSVLWGPDAFNGVVNVVPMTGKDLKGFETGLSYGAPGDPVGAFVNFGHDAGFWDAFLSISGRKGQEDDQPVNLVRFWGDVSDARSGQRPVPPAQRMGDAVPDDARYLELAGNFSFRDWFNLSGRLADNRVPYAITRSEGDLTWQESRSAPFGFLKMEAKRDVGAASAVRLMGYYSDLSPEFEVIDATLKQEERTFYSELIYDRSFFTGKGLFTGGVSYRNKKVRGAPIWSSYLPDFLGPDNEDFLPLVITEDYEARLWSAFGQYAHKFGDFDLMLGLRYDDHDQYKDHVSFSGALGWTPGREWIVKLLYGTAYRTPFARQLLTDREPDLERISTLSTQAIWKPSRRVTLSAVGFYSELENHIMDDPYAGLSLANEQEIYGTELEARFRPTESLDLTANLTLMGNSGPDETYKLLSAIEIDPDTGQIIPIFDNVNYPYDPGAKTLFNLMATWRPLERVSLFGRLGYFSSRRLVFPRQGGDESVAGKWTLDASATVRDLLFSGSELSVSVTNLLDNRYKTPGTYSFIDSRPVAVEVVWRQRW